MRQNQEIKLTIPANNQYLNLVGALLQALFERYEELSEHEDLLYNLQLGVHEICANIVQHSYAEMTPGLIKITIDSSQLPHHIKITLQDTGHLYDPESFQPPELASPQVHGYGLFLAQELIDVIEYKSEGGINYWVLGKNIIPK